MKRLKDNKWWDVFPIIDGLFGVAIGSGKRGGIKSHQFKVIDARYDCKNIAAAYKQKNMWLTKYGLSET